MKTPASRISAGSEERALKAKAPDNRRRGGTGTRLDPEVERWFSSSAVAFPPSRSLIIPMLQSAQAALGYLPRDAMQAIARHIEVPPALVEGVASFYAQFRFMKPGRHRVTVCSGTACYVRGSGKLMDDLQAYLKIVPGKTTTDGAMTLESVSCFGACALAPVVVLDSKVLRQQTSASLKKAIQDVAAGPSKITARGALPAPATRGGRK